MNIKEFNVKIPLETLPKTFRDAIVVVKSLKNLFPLDRFIMYYTRLVEDWNREAAVMSTVYQHAICNITATGASDSSKGLCLTEIRDALNYAESKCSPFSRDLAGPR